MLSVTEEEVIVMVQVMQELLCAKKLLEAMEMKIQLQMIVEVDNKGAVDLANGCRGKFARPFNNCGKF